MRELKTATNDVERKVLVNRLKEIDKTRSAMPCFAPMDGNFKRLKYVRYADDSLLGIIGSKEDAVKIKDDIKAFPCRQTGIGTIGRENARHSY